MTAVITTSGGDGLDVETLPAVPGLAGLYARGAASSGRLAAGRLATALPGIGGTAPAEDRPMTLPTVAYRVADVATDGLGAHLRDYQRLLHEPGSDTLPAGYLHVLAFPLATAVMVRTDFPLPLLGMVHLANDVTVLRPVRLGDVLEVRAWAESLRPHRRGVQVDLVAEVRVGDELAWRGVSTYLAKGLSLDAAGEAPTPDAADDGAGAASAASAATATPEGDAPEAAPTAAWTPPLPTGRWALPGGTGRAYAALSGDRNPIHLSALSAKAFGFPRAIAHGMYTAARALAEVGPQRGQTYRWHVEFAKPVLLPSTVDVAICPASAESADGFTFVGWSSARGTRHFSGTVTPLP